MPHLVRAAEIPTMYMTPSTVGAGLDPGDSFAVDLMIADAGEHLVDDTDVYAWQAMVIWDSSLLDITAFDVTFGDFMDAPRIGSWGILTQDAPAGQNVVNVTDGFKFATPGAWGGRVVIEDASNSEENEVVAQDGNRLTLSNPLAAAPIPGPRLRRAPLQDPSPPRASPSVKHPTGLVQAFQAAACSAQ